jgi:hypothetical protein
MSKTSRPMPGYPEGYTPGPKVTSTEKKPAHKDKGPSKTAGERVKALKKNIATRREAPAAKEILDVGKLTEEQLERIRLSPFFQDFEEGMWLYYKENIGDGKSEAEQEAEFEEWCEDHARENLKYLLENGELENWEDYLDNPPKTREEKDDEEDKNEPATVTDDENENAEEEPETEEDVKAAFLKALDKQLALMEKEGRITPQKAEEKRQNAKLHQTKSGLHWCR